MIVATSLAYILSMKYLTHTLCNFSLPKAKGRIQNSYASHVNGQGVSTKCNVLVGECGCWRIAHSCQTFQVLNVIVNHSGGRILPCIPMSSHLLLHYGSSTSTWNWLFLFNTIFSRSMCTWMITFYLPCTHRGLW